MGWSSGSDVMDAIIKAVQAEVHDEGTRKKIYAPLIAELEKHDWDTQDECIGADPAFDKALAESVPHWRKYID